MNKEIKKDGRVILTYGRSLMSLTAAHSLGKKNIDVIGCDDVDMTVLRFSKHVSEYFVHPNYEEDEDAYIQCLVENVRKFKPEDNRPYILMPMFRDMKVISKHKSKFDGLITVAVPNYESIDKTQPKDVFAKTCEENDLAAPKTVHPKDEGELKDAADKVGFPCLIKPTDDVGGRGIHKIDNMEELKEKYRANKAHYGIPPLVQEVIDGEDYCVSVLCDQGDVKAHMAYHNLYQFPKDSGAGIMRETIDDEVFLKTTKKLMKVLNWHGVGQIDFRWNGDKNEPAYLIEVNPRFWAGLYHCVQSGVDYPWLLYQLFSDQTLDSVEIDEGTKTKVPGFWTLSALEEIINEETHFDRLKESWLEIWANSDNKSLKERLSDFGQNMGNAVNFKDIAKKFKEMDVLEKQAISEFDIKDDPFIGLGILFILNSIIRHGKLPPELKK